MYLPNSDILNKNFTSVKTSK